VFARPLTAIVKPKFSLEPVDGGVIAFTVHPGGTGATATLSSPSATLRGGKAVVTATPTGTAGPCSVSASTGTSSATVQLKTTLG
jgi:hypothetical protein